MRSTKPKPERAFLKQIIAYAREQGWRVYHTRPAPVRAGKWLTPLLGDAGYPDLILCRPPRLLAVELKQNRRYPTPAQRAWLADLQACGIETHIWRPQDWELIKATLSRENL